MKITTCASIFFLLCYSGSSSADFMELIGVRKAAREAGTEAATKAVEAARYVTMTTNQFGLILSDYYGNDTQKKDNAKRLIEGAFGVRLQKDDQFNVDVTAVFGGLKPGQSVYADMIFMNSENEALLKKLLFTSSKFKGELINKSYAVEISELEILSKVKSTISNPQSPEECTAEKLFYSGNLSYTSIQLGNQTYGYECIKDKIDTAISNAIMVPASYQKALPASGSFSRVYPGGKYAVLIIPKNQLDAVKENLSVYISMHKHGLPEETLGEFKTPLNVDIPFMSFKKAETENKAIGSFSYYFIDLKVEGISTAEN
jgi:hypothetical protein